MSGVPDLINLAIQQLGIGEPNKFQTWYNNEVDDLGDSNWAWCAAFVSWLFEKSGNGSLIKYRAYTVYMAQDFQRAGQGLPGTTANVAAAQPGDVVLFDWGGTNNISAIDHVGIVEKNNGNGTLGTIEGNTSNKVMRRTRDASTIAYIGRPDWNGTGSDPTPGYWAYEWTNGQPLHVPDGTVILQQGSTGMNVKRLQNTLNLVFGESLTVDGDFGPLTTAALNRAKVVIGYSQNGTYDLFTANKFRGRIEAILEPPVTPPEDSEPSDPVDPADPAEWGHWHYSNATIVRPLTIPFGIIRKGDTGDHVKKLQMALNFVGAGWQVHASGTFGDCTEASVKSFQKVSVGDDLVTPLAQDGIYGHETARALWRRVMVSTVAGEGEVPGP